MKECQPEGAKYLEDLDQFDYNDEENLEFGKMMIMKWRVKYEKCFAKKFFDYCGLNSIR